MRSNYPLFLLLSFAIAFLATSCRTVPPPSVFKLSPASDTDDLRWRFGTPSIVKEASGIEVEVSTAGEFTSSITCPIRITNRSTDTLTLDPRNFYCIMSYRTDTITPGTIITARNPEIMIENYRLATTEENESYRRQQDTKGFFTLLGLALDVAVALSDTHKDKDKCGCCSDNSQTTTTEDSDEREHYDKIASIRNAQRYWETKTLRRTTLYPGESVSGHILFPMQPGTQFIDLCCPVHNDTLHFALLIHQLQ